MRPKPQRRLISSLLVLALWPSLSLAQDATSEVIDTANMFSKEATRKAREKLSELDRTYQVAVTVQTIDSLRGDGDEETAIRLARKLGHKGVFVLIAKAEKKIKAIASRPLLDDLGGSRLDRISDAIREEFRKGQVDEGLLKGVEAASAAIAAVRPKVVAPVASDADPKAPLVVRQQIKLTLAGARRAIAGAEAKALKEGWKMNITVVDDGGNLLAFARMDGARPASVATSTTKAVSAATYRLATGPIGGTSPDALLNLGIENAAAISGAKVTTLLGGVPISVEGQIIGAIGVGGGSGEQDAETAKAGVTAFLEAVKSTPAVETKPEAKKPEDSSEKPKPTEADPK
jgi:glc operon protein GlcG